jgi:SAM-dependent methyltransferase
MNNPSEVDAEGASPSQFWDEWNREWRFRDSLDAFMQRQLDEAVVVARSAGLKNARILGIGCGTGWLENGLLEFGEAWGTDLSLATIQDGEKRFPGVNLLCGDFLNIDLPGPFDLVISADSLAQMADHEYCVERVADLLRPGGIFLLMTQNPWIWKRRSAYRLAPISGSVPHSPVEEWPDMRHIRQLLKPSFTIDRVLTMDPGGDMGILWWVENRLIAGAMERIVGRYRWERLLELAGLGRELIVVARRH